MPIGPSLPPHLQAKRKRDSDESDDDSNTPKRDSSSPDASDKRRRTLGPSLPPAPLGERPPGSPNGGSKSNSDSDSDSDSEDDYGPALPGASTHAAVDSRPDATGPTAEPEPKATARDPWMLNPPQQDDLAARMDPTKMRPRKFNTGKAGRPPAGGGGGSEIDAIWTETPEQKAQRLKNSVMGVSSLSSTATAATTQTNRKQEDVEMAKRLEKARGKSLLETHQGRKDKEEEDDPSKRAFDYAKDVGGNRVGHGQKKELLGRAKEFGSRFSGGSYL